LLITRSFRSRIHKTTVAALLALIFMLAGCTTARSAAPPAERAAPVAGFTTTYVAIGASDAFGMGTEDPPRQSWPTVLSSELGPRVHLINLGVPGTTTAQALQTELPIAVDARPDMVTVWLGVNDLLDGVPLSAYETQLRQLLVTLRQHTQARIVAGNLPDLTYLPLFYGADTTTLRATIRHWNDAIAAACRATGVTLVDLYSGWSELARHPEYISSDGFHPSAAGARRLAELFAAALRATPTPPMSPRT
jgi:lysophospholipase L1-like esterase